MSKQISIEQAFPTFRKRCTELFEENLVLRTQVDVLERLVAELEQETTALRAQPGPDAPQHLGGMAPDGAPN